MFFVTGELEHRIASPNGQGTREAGLKGKGGAKPRLTASRRAETARQVKVILDSHPSAQLAAVNKKHLTYAQTLHRS